MSDILLVITPDQDPQEWHMALAAAGLAYSLFPSMPRIIQVHNTTPATFPLRTRRGVESIEVEAPIKGAAVEQPFTIQADLSHSSGSWALARTIRRKAPWPRLRPRFPFETFYRAERDGDGVDYYSCDSGIRTTHENFNGRATNRYDATGQGVQDDNGHGTLTTGTACGLYTGFARAALIHSYKCLQADNSGTTTQLVDALSAALSFYLTRSRPAVVNCSLSFSSASAAVNTAISDCINAGMVVVASAGNDKEDLGVVTKIPAESDADVIVAGGTGIFDLPYYSGASGTNWGTRVDVLAPSQNVWTSNRTSDTAYSQAFGTSFAAPCVSGVVACLLTGMPRLTGRTQVQAIRNHIRDTATTGELRAYTFGGAITTLPDRILYMDPDVLTETIPGL